MCVKSVEVSTDKKIKELQNKNIELLTEKCVWVFTLYINFLKKIKKKCGDSHSFYILFSTLSHTFVFIICVNLAY